MVYGMVWRREGRIRWARVEEAAAEAKKAGGASCPAKVEEAAAEAKKAGGASCPALRIPRPPWLTGREAWSQAGSLFWKLMLKAWRRWI